MAKLTKSQRQSLADQEENDALRIHQEELFHKFVSIIYYAQKLHSMNRDWQLLIKIEKEPNLLEDVIPKFYIKVYKNDSGYTDDVNVFTDDMHLSDFQWHYEVLKNCVEEEEQAKREKDRQIELKKSALEKIKNVLSAEEIKVLKIGV